MEFEEQEVDSATFDDDATEAFDGIAEEIQKEGHHLIVGFEFKPLLAAAENYTIIAYGSALSETIFDDARGRGNEALFISFLCNWDFDIFRSFLDTAAGSQQAFGTERTVP